MNDLNLANNKKKGGMLASDTDGQKGGELIG